MSGCNGAVVQQAFGSGESPRWLVTGKEGKQIVAPRGGEKSEIRNPKSVGAVAKVQGWKGIPTGAESTASLPSSRLLVWRPVRTTTKVCLDCSAPGLCRNHNATQPPGERFRRNSWIIRAPSRNRGRAQVSARKTAGSGHRFVTRRSAPRIGFPGAGAPDPLPADRWFWPVPARRTAVACAVRGLPSPMIGPGDVLPEEDCDPCAGLLVEEEDRVLQSRTLPSSSSQDGCRVASSGPAVRAAAGSCVEDREMGFPCCPSSGIKVLSIFESLKIRQRYPT